MSNLDKNSKYLMIHLVEIQDKWLCRINSL